MEKKLISIMQPTYMPWLGYFSMIDKADEFVFLNSVQLSNRSWQVRNKIKYNGGEKLLTIPIDKTLPRDKRMINTTPYANEEWKNIHLKTIYNAYRKAKYFSTVYDFLLKLYECRYGSIGKFTSSIISNVCEKIGITTPLLSSDSLSIEGRKDALLVDICKKLNATDYLSAQGSFCYIEAETSGGSFIKNGIGLYYQNYEHPTYQQCGEGFVSHMGIYDLLFNVGFENALGIIRDGARKDFDYMEYQTLVLAKRNRKTIGGGD